MGYTLGKSNDGGGSSGGGYTLGGGTGGGGTKTKTTTRKPAQEAVRLAARLRHSQGVDPAALNTEIGTAFSGVPAGKIVNLGERSGLSPGDVGWLVRTGTNSFGPQRATRYARMAAGTSGPHREDLLKKLEQGLEGYDAKRIQTIASEAGLSQPEVARLRQMAPVDQRYGGQSALARTIILDLPTRPMQAVVSGVAGSETGKPFDFGRALQGLLGKDRTTPVEAGYESIGGQTRGQAQRSSAALNPILRGTANFVGATLADPLTYIGFGATASAKEAAVVAAERAAQVGEREAPEILADILKGGTRSLPDAEQVALRDLPSALKRRLAGAGGGIKFAGRTVPGTEGLTAAHAPEALVPDRVEQSFRTLPGVREGERSGVLAPGTVGDVESALNRAQAARSEAQRAGDALYRASRPLGEESRLRVTQALENPSLVPGLDRHERGLFDLADSLRHKITGEQVAAGLLGHGHDTETYFPRFLADEGQQVRTAGVASGNPRSLTSRTAGNLRARDVNLRDVPTEQILNEFGNPKFELDPAAAMFRRVNLAKRDIGRVQLTDDLSKINDAAGTPLLRTADHLDAESAALLENARVNDTFGDSVVKQVQVQIEDPETGALSTGEQKVLVHKALAQDPAFDKAITIMSSEAAQRDLLRSVSKATTLWKGYATVFGPFTGGFALRNFLGNIVNGYWLPGVGLNWYEHGIGTWRAMSDAIKSGAHDITGLIKNPTYSRWAQEALDRDVLFSGFYSHELRGEGSVAEKLASIRETQSPLGRLGHNVNPFSNDNALIRGGRAMNTGIEDSGRLGMFMGLRAKGYTPDAAARLVNKYLFDYSNLSVMDEKFKAVIPFWSWTRFNVPLQLETLLKSPGKITTQLHALEALNQPGTTPGMPNWQREEGGVNLGGGNTFVPDLPVTSAMDSVKPVQSWWDALYALGKGEPADRLLQEAARDTYNAAGPGGPVPGGLAALGQIAAGKQVFSGGEFPPGQTQYGLPSNLAFLLENVLPVGPGLAKARRIVSPTGGRSRAQTALSQFGGVNVSPQNATRSEWYRRQDILDQLRQWVANQGGQVPLKDWQK